MSKPITLKHKLAAPITAPAISQITQIEVMETAHTVAGNQKAPAKSLLIKFVTGVKKLAEVADGVDKIRNAIEGVYKLAGAIWPVFLLLWPN